MSDQRPHGGDERLTDAERRALDALPSEKAPGRLLEERTVAALRERGLLASAPHGSERPARGSRRGATWQWVAAAAAAVLLFASGVSVGQMIGSPADDRSGRGGLRIA